MLPSVQIQQVVRDDGSFIRSIMVVTGVVSPLDGNRILPDVCGLVSQRCRNDLRALPIAIS